MTYSLTEFSAGILQNVGSEAHTINYLEYGATGFIIAHELGEQISHIVNQLVSSRRTENWIRGFNNSISIVSAAHRSESVVRGSQKQFHRKKEMPD